jgi:hypothetical protein
MRQPRRHVTHRPLPTDFSLWRLVCRTDQAVAGKLIEVAGDDTNHCARVLDCALIVSVILDPTVTKVFLSQRPARLVVNDHAPKPDSVVGRNKGFFPLGISNAVDKAINVEAERRHLVPDLNRFLDNGFRHNSCPFSLHHLM